MGVQQAYKIILPIMFGYEWFDTKKLTSWLLKMLTKCKGRCTTMYFQFLCETSSLRRISHLAKWWDFQIGQKPPFKESKSSKFLLGEHGKVSSSVSWQKRKCTNQLKVKLPLTSSNDWIISRDSSNFAFRSNSGAWFVLPLRLRTCFLFARSDDNQRKFNSPEQQDTKYSVLAVRSYFTGSFL